MSTMNWTELTGRLSLLAPLLAMGITLFLALGCVLVLLTRSPVHRQRLGELTLVGALIWTILAFVPLPRLVPGLLFSTISDSIENGPRTPKSVETSSTEHRSPTALSEAADMEDQVSRVPNVQADPLPAAVAKNHLEEMLASEQQLSTNASSEPTTAPDLLDPQVDSRPGEESPRSVAASSSVPVAAVTNTASLSSQFTWSTILLSLYLSAACVCTAWLLIGQVLLFRIRRQSQPAERWLADLFDSLTPAATRPRAELLVSTRCQRAISWGIRRPAIVLPWALCRRENQGQLRTILLHELGHVAQRDAWGNLLICLALPLMYFHPLFWWLRVQIRLAAELVADDWAAQQAGKETYVEDLVMLAKTARGRGSLLPGVTGVLSSPSQFYRRMNMLLAREEPLLTRPSVAWRTMTLGTWMLAVVLATSIAGVHPVAGQTAAEPPVAAAANVPAPPATTPPAPAAVPAPPVTVTAEPAAPTATLPELPAVEKKPNSAGQVITAEPAKTDPNVPVKKIEQQKAELRSELSKIMQRLEALERESGTMLTTTAAAANKFDTFAGKTVTFPRVDDKGILSMETWTVDDSGKPSKLVSRVQSTPSNVITEVRNENGQPSVVLHMLDDQGRRYEIQSPGASDAYQRGKKAALPRTPTPGKSGIVVRSPVEIPGSPYTTPPLALPAPQPGFQLAGERSNDAAQPLDLISLATSYADAIGAVESAKAEVDAARNQRQIVESTTQPAQAVATAQKELTAAEIGLRNAQRKENLLRRIVTSATANAERDLARLKQLQEKGVITVNVLQDVESRVEILKQIIEPNGTDDVRKTEAKGS